MDLGEWSGSGSGLSFLMFIYGSSAVARSNCTSNNKLLKRSQSQVRKRKNPRGKIVWQVQNTTQYYCIILRPTN